MSLDYEEALYDPCRANEIRFFRIESRNIKPGKRQIPEYRFFNRFAGICYLVAGGFGVVLQTLLIFWLIACFLGQMAHLRPIRSLREFLQDVPVSAHAACDLARAPPDQQRSAP